MASYTETERKYEVRQLKRRMGRYALIFLALLGSIVTLQLWDSSAGRSINYWAMRQSFQLRGAVPPPEEIIIIAVDEEIQEKFGRPLPRGVIAKALDVLGKAKPKIVIFDLAFPRDGSEPEADQKIASVLAALPTVIGAGQINTEITKDSFIDIEVDEIFKSAASHVMPMLFTRTDNTIRYISRNFKEKSDLYTQVPIARPLVELAGFSLIVPGKKDLINYYGPSGTIKRVPLQDLLDKDDNFSVDTFDGKVVFVGFQTVSEKSDSGLSMVNDDAFSISYSKEPMFGVEIHATIAGNLIEQSWIRTLGFFGETAIVFISSFIIYLILIFLPIKVSYVFTSVLLVAGVFTSYALFTFHRLWISAVPVVVICAIFSVVFVALYREFYLSSLNRFIARRLGK